MRLDLQAARALLVKRTAGPVKSFYLHHVSFLDALLHQDEHRIADFFTATFRFEQELLNDRALPYFDFFAAELYLERAAIFALTNKLIFAGVNIKKCHHHTRHLERYGPAVSGRFKGLFLVAFSAVPKRYAWIFSVLNLKGDAPKGISYLRQAAAGEFFLHHEVDAGLYFILRHWEADRTKAADVAKRLYGAAPDNALYAFIAGHQAIEQHQNEEAIRLLSAVTSREAALFPFVTGLLAKAYLQKLDFDRAIQNYQQFLKAFHGKVYLADAYYKRGVAYELKNARHLAISDYRQAVEGPTPLLDEDRYAVAQSKIMLQRPMAATGQSFYQARLQINGGYYSAALSLLNAVQPQSPGEHLELNYWFGRLHQNLKKHPQALAYYQKTADFDGGQVSLWMEVYALYFSGEIYESTGRPTQALEAYKQALRHNNYEYQTGLEQKVKTAIRRLERR